MSNTIEISTELRIKALAAFLDCEPDDLSESRYDDTIIESGREEYLVLTDEEADEKAKERILQDVWCFRPEFLESYMPNGVDAEIISIIQNAKYEDASEPLLSMMTDQDEFVSDAIGADGRGHFLAQYDSNENEVDIEVDSEDLIVTEEKEEYKAEYTEKITFYIYRTN